MPATFGGALAELAPGGAIVPYGLIWVYAGGAAGGGWPANWLGFASYNKYLDTGALAKSIEYLTRASQTRLASAINPSGSTLVVGTA